MSETAAATDVAPEPAPAAPPEAAPAPARPAYERSLLSRRAAPGSIARFFKNTWAITAKEVGIYFTTPIAYALFSVFIFILSYFFIVFVKQYLQWTVQAQQMAQFQPGMADQLNFTDMIFSPMIGNAGVVLIFIVPFLTMRLVAEEKTAHTFQLLMTTPVRSWEIVLGKYLSSAFVMAVAIGLTAMYPLILNSLAEDGGVEWQTAGVGYLGLFLLAASFIAIGLAVSSMTESQVVAAAVTFGILLLMWVLSWAASSLEEPSKGIVEYVCALTHLRTFLKGTINLADVTYFASLTGVCLFISRTAIERERW